MPLLVAIHQNKTAALSLQSLLVCNTCSCCFQRINPIQRSQKHAIHALSNTLQRKFRSTCRPQDSTQGNMTFSFQFLCRAHFWWAECINRHIDPMGCFIKILISCLSIFCIWSTYNHRGYSRATFHWFYRWITILIINFKLQLLLSIQRSQRWTLDELWWNNIHSWRWWRATDSNFLLVASAATYYWAQASRSWKTKYCLNPWSPT